MVTAQAADDVAIASLRVVRALGSVMIGRVESVLAQVTKGRAW